MSAASKSLSESEIRKGGQGLRLQPLVDLIGQGFWPMRLSEGEEGISLDQDLCLQAARSSETPQKPI